MSTKQFGCFFCPGKSTDENGKCDKCYQPVNVKNELLSLPTIDDYKPVSVLGRGFYGWTLRVEDKYQDFAMKIVPIHRSEYRHRPSDEEARALVKCSPHRNLARFVRSVNSELVIRDRAVPVFCLVFDYISNAQPLSHLLRDDTLRLAAQDVVSILVGIASGLDRMHGNNLWHDDLHDDNILVRQIDEDENLTERFEPKLIDFGSAKARNPHEPEHGERGDYFYLSKHITNLVARFERGIIGAITPHDRAFNRELRIIARGLADHNVSRRALTPREVTMRIQEAGRSRGSSDEFPPFDTMLNERHSSLKHPFDTPNALRHSPQDIAQLFIDELGWVQQITMSQPVIVVGPRGCGKTMLLRHLSIRSVARPQKTESSHEHVANRLNQTPYFGVIVSVADLRTPFFRSSFKDLKDAKPDTAEDFCREYLNIHFVIELVRCLLWLNREQLAPFSEQELDSLALMCDELLDDDTAPHNRGLDASLEAAERRAVELSNLTDPTEYRPSHFCRDDILETIAREIKRIQWFVDRELWFLLDDYSVPLIPEFVALAYNPILFRPSTASAGDFRIRISSEGEGPPLEDNFGRRYREGREFSRVNLGEIYFLRKEGECRLFLERVIARRFEETGEGSIDDLYTILGEHPHETGFGNYIRETPRAGDARFFGFGLICSLCSGDLGSILELFGKLYRNSSDQKLQISAAKQDRIVKQFAQDELRQLRLIHDTGPIIYGFAVEIGGLLRDYLVNSPPDREPDERLRIEVEGTGELSNSGKIIHQQLLQHSVLISAGGGKDRKGLPTHKYILRRLYASCFPFSPARKGTIKVTFEDYDQWLQNPIKNIPKYKHKPCPEDQGQQGQLY